MKFNFDDGSNVGGRDSLQASKQSKSSDKPSEKKEEEIDRNVRVELTLKNSELRKVQV